MSKSDESTANRRQFLKYSVSTGAASMAFSALSQTGSELGGGTAYSAGYGPLKPAKCMATGLTLLALPEGFEYMSFGWAGQIMDDGRPTPSDPDGMAVVAKRGNTVALVRNHELSAGESNQCFVQGGMYNIVEYGGTTNLLFDFVKGEFVKSYTSLGGTIRNCAGGRTPWESWISCEETYHLWDEREDGYNHGYVFDVPGFGVSKGVPVKAAGRFAHEAVAIDPNTGVMYETEDAGTSAFYKYVQPGAGHNDWQDGREEGELLRDGGELYAMILDGMARKNMSVGYEPGVTFPVSWELVGDPEGIKGRAFDSAPSAANFSRGEGCWEDDGKIYFVSTNGGAAGLGQVWMYDPKAETVALLYESTDASVVDGPDNIAISPRGGIILCEDGASNPKRLIGLSHSGEIFTFAENRIVLNTGDIDVIDAVYPGTKANFSDPVVGDYRSMEWAGATFYGDWLFANIMSPGATFAIRGPWKRGIL